MARKKTRGRTRRPSGRIEEFTESRAPQGVVELASEEAAVTQSAAAKEAKVEAASGDPSALIAPPKFFTARDKLQARMGGEEAVASALLQPSEAAPTGPTNIVGWGVGEKIQGGRGTGAISVKVFVAEKLRLSHVPRTYQVPEEIDGCPTDVEEVGDVTALRFTGRYRPAPGGSSIGHFAITAGTLGCLVVRKNNHLCILSNNHVLANSNSAALGDNILQPGPVDGGRNPHDRIGVLEVFVPILFGGVPNYVDGALAWTNFALSSARHHSYQISTTPRQAALAMSVRKCGRTTQSTLGVITAVGVNINVRFGSRVAFFREQIQIRGVGGLFSQGGDSGSLIVTAGTRQPVGLLFAGGGDSTFANPIGRVMSALGISRFLG